jgi:epoxide hydrolase
MRRLGYQRYADQGGDLSALITPAHGRVAPESVIGIHVNAATVGFSPLGPVPEDVQAQLTDQERQRVASLDTFGSDGSGYMAIQSTPPADPRLRLDRLSGRATRLDDGEVQGVVEPSAELPEDAVDRTRCSPT